MAKVRALLLDQVRFGVEGGAVAVSIFGDLEAIYTKSNIYVRKC